jgi:hypothetical protein
MNYKAMIQNALPTWNGRLAAHHVCYNGNGQVHRAIPYATSAYTEAIIIQKLKLMQLAGVDVVIGTWQGPWANGDASLFSSLCADFGMQFALLLDPGGMQKWKGAGQGSSVITENVISALSNSATEAILEATSYVPEKYVLDFNTGANLATLAKTFPSLNFLAMNQGFSWISIPSITDSVLRNAESVENLKAQHENPAMRVASVCFSFDDSGQPLPVGVSTQAAFDEAGGNRDLASSVWGGNARILDSFSGQFGQQQLATIPPTVPIIAIITLDDYDEQSSAIIDLTRPRV